MNTNRLTPYLSFGPLVPVALLALAVVLLASPLTAQLQEPGLGTYQNAQGETCRVVGLPGSFAVRCAPVQEANLSSGGQKDSRLNKQQDQPANEAPVWLRELLPEVTTAQPLAGSDKESPWWYVHTKEGEWLARYATPKPKLYLLPSPQRMVEREANPQATAAKGAR